MFSDKKKNEKINDLANTLIKGMADVGSAAMIAKAIREHTRATIALEFVKNDLVWANLKDLNLQNLPFDGRFGPAFILADEFIKASKYTAADEVSQPNT
jgi:hypothetical protein